METVTGRSSRFLKYLGALSLLLVSTAASLCQRLPAPMRLWSVAPLTATGPVVNLTIGSQGAILSAPHGDSHTGSIFAATRSVVFAGDRIVLASPVDRRIEGARGQTVYVLLSLDLRTGEVKNTRNGAGFIENYIM